MRVSISALKQQAWRAERLYHSLRQYALGIGCTVLHDEIVCNTEEQARLLAAWWMEHIND